MFSIYRNSYLHLSTSEVNARTINRCVDLARNQQSLCDDFFPPFNRLTSEQPTIPCDNIDPTRRPQAFGRLALPILRRQLHSNDPTIVIQAIATIGDLVHDPERGYEAISLDITDRMADLLNDQFPQVREQTAVALRVMAGLALGREAIVNNHFLMENLLIGLADSVDDVRIKMAACVEMVARTWMTADVLVDFGFIPTLLGRLIDEKDEIVVINLDCLQSLMYCEGKHDALKDGFPIFVTLLERDCDEIVRGALDCLKILTSAPLGKKMAIETDLLNTVNPFLHSDKTEICTSAASVITFCTVKTRAKHLACTIHNLAQRLVTLMKNPLNPFLQLHCIKALTNICEHPMIRKEVAENYLDDILNVQTEIDPSFKDTLLKIINWQPHVL